MAHLWYYQRWPGCDDAGIEECVLAVHIVSIGI